MLIINSMHLENRDLPANLNLCSGERTLEDSTYLCPGRKSTLKISMEMSHETNDY